MPNSVVIVIARVGKTTQLMVTIKKIKDPQSEILLLRDCAGVSKLYFTMRTTNPQFMQSAQIQYDQYLFHFLRYLITGDGPGFGPRQQCIATLPMKDGGLGVYTMEDTIQYCDLDSCFQTSHLQNTILQKVHLT